MPAAPDPVDAILKYYNLPGPWQQLPVTGLANRIYATAAVVLRVATDHPEALPDARTESVAAPVAYAAGVRTPRLLAFDDTRSLIDRPFSLWERIHGRTLGLVSTHPLANPNTWQALGEQLGLLHRHVKTCPDPHGYLDEPGRELDLDPLLRQLVSLGRVDLSLAQEIERLAAELRPAVEAATPAYFLHNDVHAMNVMCTDDDSLLALIDWGDAGWGDPILEFAMIPVPALSYVLAGYESVAPARLGDAPEARIIWDKLYLALERLWDDPPSSLNLSQFRAFLGGRRL